MFCVSRITIATFVTIVCVLIVTANSNENEKNDKKHKKLPIDTNSDKTPDELLKTLEDETKNDKEKNGESKNEENADSELEKLKEVESEVRKLEDKEKLDEKEEEKLEEVVKDIEEKEEEKLEGEEKKKPEEEEEKKPEEEEEKKQEEEEEKKHEEGEEENAEAPKEPDNEEKNESPVSPSPNSKEESETSDEIESAPENSYAVWNSKGKICLLARLNATFAIVYPSHEGEQKAKVSLTHGKSKGKCESSSKSPLLQISWDKFVFTMIFNKSDEENWVVSSLEFTYDTSGDLFDGAINVGKKTARSKVVGLFETSLGKSYFCPAQEVVLLYAANKQVVTARLTDLHLQPYGIEDGKFSQFHRCNKVIIDGLDETPFVQDETVPLAVGCTLALITLSILIGFAVHRAYHAAKVDYNNME